MGGGVAEGVDGSVDVDVVYKRLWPLLLLLLERWGEAIDSGLEVGICITRQTLHLSDPFPDTVGALRCAALRCAALQRVEIRYKGARST
jgi:hypothetical protein